MPRQAGSPGAFGAVPPARGTPHAGTITVAEPPGATPNWIFPVNLGGHNSVYTAFSFQDEMWRPLYWYANGVAPTETPAMSLASAPVYSNGGRTVTITLKNNYKWSDGLPLTSADALFLSDEARAAVEEDPANWAGYTPNVGLPDQVISVSTPTATTLVLNLNSAVNPLWMTEDELAIQPNAGPRLGEGLGERPHPGLHQASEREEDLRLPRRGARSR